MGIHRGNCPKCGSSKTMKEKINGSHTGDLICLDCKYVGLASGFEEVSSSEAKTKLNNEQ